jgi:Alginate lyase
MDRNLQQPMPGQHHGQIRLAAEKLTESVMERTERILLGCSFRKETPSVMCPLRNRISESRKPHARRPDEKWPLHTRYSRRDFCKAAGMLALAAAVDGPSFLAEASTKGSPRGFDVVAIDRARVLFAAQRYLKEPPITITASTSKRSPGGKHEYYSEADYFWPDPNNSHGPYIQRDGISNPNNFLDHRRFLLRLSVQAPALAAAWRISGEKRYAEHAALHLRAWFVDKSTRMKPNLQYAQAIRGSTTGTRYGVIDTLQLVEVVRAAETLVASRVLSKDELDEIKSWFADYLEWMTTDPKGIEEMESPNNHATCWVTQVAAFAEFTGNKQLADYARRRFESVLISDQMKTDGSFPLEMSRTKPYAYSLFNLDAMATICQILSTPQDDLWTFRLADGRGIGKAVAFMEPYIRNKKSWPLPPDVMYAKDWPMRQCSLLFAGLALDRVDYLQLWKTLPADSDVEEVIRNFFIRQPVLWV